jgi:hypothetical protein
MPDSNHTPMPRQAIKNEGGEDARQQSHPHAQTGDQEAGGEAARQQPHPPCPEGRSRKRGVKLPDSNHTPHAQKGDQEKRGNAAARQQPHPPAPEGRLRGCSSRRQPSPRGNCTSASDGQDHGEKECQTASPSQDDKPTLGNVGNAAVGPTTAHPKPRGSMIVCNRCARQPTLLHTHTPSQTDGPVNRGV